MNKADKSTLNRIFGENSSYMKSVSSYASKIKSQNRRDSYSEDVITTVKKNKSVGGVDVTL